MCQKLKKQKKGKRKGKKLKKTKTREKKGASGDQYKAKLEREKLVAGQDPPASRFVLCRGFMGYHKFLALEGASNQCK